MDKLIEIKRTTDPSETIELVVDDSDEITIYQGIHLGDRYSAQVVTLSKEDLTTIIKQIIEYRSDLLSDIKLPS